MQLTPDDIQQQQFHMRFRGFDVDEVDGFLEKVGENFLLITKEKKDLEEKVTQLENQLAEFKDREKTFQNVILSTQKLADEIEERSRKEADKRLQETREEIDRLKESARTEAADLEKQVEELKKTKTRIKQELKEFLNSYLTLLEKDAPLEGGATIEPPGPVAAAAPVFQEEEIEIEEEYFSLEEEEDTGSEGEQEEKPEEQEEEDNLYEKIELPDLDLPGIDDSLEENEPETKENDIFGDEIPDWEVEKEEDQKNAQDLDDKIFFSLDDPIDYESEPEVIIDDKSSNDSEESEKQ